MKNIHILPTDKPSRLCIDNSCNELNYSDIEGYSSKHITNQHIYITSDEEIKEGDWFYCFQNNNVLKCFKKEGLLLNGYHTIYKKIILTTDQDLIAEGVQPIDDEFLEWFVKNPSCESVEVKKGFADGTAWGYNFLDYKIIIPQEEPKQELELKDFESSSILDVLNMGNVEYLGNGDIIYNPNLFFIKRGDKWFIKNEEPKQETLEEAAEIDLSRLCVHDKRNPDYFPYDEDDLTREPTKCGCDNCFYGRAELTEQLIKQAERMYSEEEVKDMLFEALNHKKEECCITHTTDLIVRKVFKQFKKK